MTFDELAETVLPIEDVELSTMMRTPCIRYKGEFVSMMFDKKDSLIVKLPEERVHELVERGAANYFDFTSKRFKEWVLIPYGNEKMFEKLVKESIDYMRNK